MTVNAFSGLNIPFSGLQILTPQTIYYTTYSTGGTPGFGFSVTGYSI